MTNAVEEKRKVPKLRFPEFRDDWATVPVSDLVRRVGESVNVKASETYREIGIRSHGRGIFHKEPVSGAQLGNKRVFHVVPGSLAFNIVFAWEQAVASLSEAENGFIASHRFPMYLPKRGKSDTNFLREFFLRPRGKYLLEIASPGGAGRNKTLGQKDLLGLKVTVPCQQEQRKIAAFLRVVDEKIGLLERNKELWEAYKKGCIQKLFSREIRFKRDDGTDFPDWKEWRLGNLGSFKSGIGFPKNEQGGNTGIPFYKVSDMNLPGNEYRMTAANNYMTPEQIDRLGYKPITQEAIIFAKVGAAIFLERKRTAKEFLIDNNMMAFVPSNSVEIKYLPALFANIRLSKFAQVGALPSYNGSDLATIKVLLPSGAEQSKIADFLSAIDDKIAHVTQELKHARTFKKGLLQQMFV